MWPPGSAIDEALGWGLAHIRDRVYALAGLLRARLAAIPGCQVRDQGTEQCGIVTFTVDGVPADEIKDRLAGRSINVSVSRAPSTLLDMIDRGLASVVRASVHYYNTEEEMDRLLEELAD